MFKKNFDLFFISGTALLFNILINYPLNYNFFISFFVALFYFSLIIYSNLLFILGIFFYFTTSAIGCYFQYYYKIQINLNTIGILFDTNIQEAINFIDIYLIFWILIIFLVSCSIIFIFYKFKIKFQKKKFLFFSIILIIILFIFGKFFHYKKIIKKTYPRVIIVKTINYFREQIELMFLIKRKKDIPYNFLKFNESKPLTIVLIIGESARSDHFHIYGYNRQTTPLLEKQKNLIHLKCKSLAASTRKSLPIILTRYNKFNPKIIYREKSIISLFNKLNFITAWISNQKAIGRGDTSIASFAHECKYIFFNNIKGDYYYYKLLDGDLITPFKNFLHKYKNKNKFIILHTIGSHITYDFHYPENFKIFKPTTKKNPSIADKHKVINSYDNTILYTDYFIYKVIQELKNYNSILFYTSDHGEFLGEHNRWAHGEPLTKEVTNVPFFVWFSNKILKEKIYEEKFKNILLFQKDNTIIDHSWVFHSLLDCANIYTNIINYKKSICSKIKIKNIRSQK